MFYNINRKSSNDGDAFVSPATMRAHVRAIDSDEDTLLAVYRDAAIDYLQNLSDRVLGLSTAEVLLNQVEFKTPFRIQKLQDISRVLKLEYMKDGVYQTYTGPVVPDNDPNITATATVSGTGPWQVTISDASAPVSGELFKYNFWSEEYESVGTFSDLTPPYEYVLENQEAGLYKYVTNVAAQSGEALYYSLNNGALFKHRAHFDQYPGLFDFSLLCEEIEYDEKAQMPFRLTVECGTAYTDLPAQYRQAALLLIGHYFNMREAENIGGITTELKEGVRRLVASVKQY